MPKPPLTGIMSRLSKLDVAVVLVLSLSSPRCLSHAKDGGALLGEDDMGPAASASSSVYKGYVLPLSCCITTGCDPVPKLGQHPTNVVDVAILFAC